MNLSKKGMNISGSMTLAITAKAGQMRKEGIDVISFGAGEPDFDTPVHIQNSAVNAIKKGLTRYTPASGILELKTCISEKLKKENGLEYQPSQIVVSNGAKHSLFNTFQALCNPGDEVIIPVPYWVSYEEHVKLADGIPVFVETKEENGFRIDRDMLLKAVSGRTKAIILNSPNNPTGAIYPEEDLRMIAQIAVENDIVIISDEIYEKLVYDGKEHMSIASFGEDIKQRTVLINGMSKAYAMTGWRIGYTAAGHEITKVMSNIQSHATSNPNTIAQYASVDALTEDQAPVEEMRKEFEKRRNYMVDTINSIPMISCKKPQGAFYVMINISKVKGKAAEGKAIDGSLTFCEALLDKARVAAIPGIAFGADDYVRVSYATSMENIVNGLKRIGEFVGTLK
jgi:aspartate aminotransferase